MKNTATSLNVSQPTLALLPGRKFYPRQQKAVLKILKAEPNITSPDLIRMMKKNNDPLSITERHLNRIRASWGLNRSQGRPKNEKKPDEFNKKGAILALEPHLPNIGLHLLDEYLESLDFFCKTFANTEPGY